MERAFKSMCGSEFWVFFKFFEQNHKIILKKYKEKISSKNSKTIYSINPDFTFCFRYSILTWIPPLTLWLSAPFWIYMLTKSVHSVLNQNFSLLFISRVVLTASLIFVEIFYSFVAIVESRNMVYLVTPIVLISTYVSI